MVRASCMPFSGLAGEILMTVMSCAAIAFCVIRYQVEHRRGADRRPMRVYVYDMSKIAISQSAAWLVNLWITNAVFQMLLRTQQADSPDHSSRTTGELLEIEGIGWYTVVFLMDFVVGVPLGLYMGRFVNMQADAWWSSYLASILPRSEAVPRRSLSIHFLDTVDDDPLFELVALDNGTSSGPCYIPPNDELPFVPRWSEQNRIYGKYSRLHSGKYEVDTFVDAWGPELSLRWWWSQTISWSCCVSLSRLFSGAFMLAILALCSTPANPIIQVAQAITNLPLSCSEKQWLVAGFMRIAVDVLQLLVIDAVNKFRTKPIYETLS